MDKVRIHFTDSISNACIECTADEFHETYKNLQEDPECYDIWCEFHDEEEGWQV